MPAARCLLPAAFCPLPTMLPVVGGPLAGGPLAGGPLVVVSWLLLWQVVETHREGEQPSWGRQVAGTVVSMTSCSEKGKTTQRQQGLCPKETAGCDLVGMI